MGNQAQSSERTPPQVQAQQPEQQTQKELKINNLMKGNGLLPSSAMRIEILLS